MSVINKTIKTLLASFVLIGTLLFSHNAYAFCNGSICETYEDAIAYCDVRRLVYPSPTYQWCAGPDAPGCAYCRISPPTSPGNNPFVDHGRWSNFLGIFIVEAPQFIINRYPIGQDNIKSMGGGRSNTSAPNSAANITPLSCNPINIASGNKFKKQTDITKTPYNIGFSRYYNSRTGYSGDLGKKWTHTYSRQLKPIGGNNFNFQLIRPDGKGVNYMSVDDNGSANADADVTATLKKRNDTNGVQIGWQYVGHDNIKENYDLNGKLTSTTTLGGLSETLSYDASNRLSQVVNNVGYSLTFAYDASNRIRSMMDQAGRVWLYTYDANSNLSTVTHPDTTQRNYQYENPTFVNLLTGITDERGLRFATYEYNAVAEATGSYLGGQSAVLTERISGVSLVHNTDGSKTLTDSRGNVSIHQTAKFFGLNIVSQTIGPTCSSGAKNTSYNYDFSNNNLLSKTVDGLTTQYGDYSAQGYPGYKILAPGTPQARRTDFTYDSRFYNQVTGKTEPSVCAAQQKITNNVYDANANITSRIVNGYTPQCTAVTRTTTYQYNGPLNQLSQIDGPRTDVSDITTLTYYPLTHATPTYRGRLRTITAANGIDTRADIQYTTTGKPQSYLDANGILFNFSYYPGNDRLQTLTQSKTSTSVVTRWTYLETGEVASVTTNPSTADAVTISMTYDQARRLTKITDGLGNYIQYTLDTEGNKTDTEYYDPANQLTRRLSQSFDVYNRADITLQENESTNQTFNADGTLKTSADGKNTLTQYTYDTLKRLTQTVQDSGGTSAQTQNATAGFEYDIADRMTKVTDPINGVTTYEYDDLGNRLKKISPDTQTTTMTYDVRGNVKTLSDAKSQLFTYSYDALNRLTNIDAPGTSDDITYTYDTCANGKNKLCSATQGSITTTYAYNDLGSVSNHQNIRPKPTHQNRDLPEWAHHINGQL